MSNGLPLSAFLPSYQELFGDFSPMNGDDGRSVYSPAAYLADLLELVDDNFAVSPLRERRPDLAGVPLDWANSYTEVPYLDIVNEVLARRVGKDADTTLRTLRLPVNLPFSLRAERFKAYLRRFEVSPDELYRRFAVLADADVVAREYLGLAADDVLAITEVVGGAPARFAQLADVERFRQATTLSATEVRELLYQNLGPAQRADAAAFFIHQDGPCVTLDDQEQRLLWAGGDGAIPEEWFDRVTRFVRLARKTGMSLSDLDLVLRTCCGNELDATALRIVAAVTVLRRGFDLPVDVVCSLVAHLNTVGLGDEDRAASLFSRVFGTLPTATGDILAEANKPLRRWLATVLPLTEADLVTIVTRYRSRPTPRQFELGLADLSLLHRIGCLTSVLNLSVEELFHLLDALESDPSMPRFPVPIDTVPADAAPSTDYYRVLAGGAPTAGLWLMQVLLTTVGWLQAAGLDGAELVRILGGPAVAPTEEDIEEQRELEDQLRQQFGNVAFQPDWLASDRFSPRAAAVLHRVLAARTDGVVSQRDARLLRVDRDVAAKAAYQGLVELSAVTAQDFRGLGLDEGLTAKIFANLVVHGYLDSDGRLVEELLADPELGLTTDFDDLRDGVFWAISALCENPPASFYQSDLAEVAELSDTELAELYDNLVFHGYLDNDGNVFDPDFFTNPDNLEAFSVSLDLSVVEDTVFARLRERVTRYTEQRLALDPEIFAGLGLTEAQRTDLLVSLRFNGYLDADNRYVAPVALDTLDLTGFGLAVEFYPYRRDVLAAMRAHLETSRAEFTTFGPADFQDIADDAMAGYVVELLGNGYLVDGHVPEELRPELLEPSPDLWLADELTESETATVFQQLAAILTEQQAYQLDFTALTDLEFTLDESAELVGLLIAEGHLTPELTIPEDRLSFFTNVNNALTFSLEGFEDYSADVFFLLYNVAAELSAGVAEVVDTLAGVAQEQLATLVTVLRDAFGVEAMDAICRAVAGDGPDALDVLVAPVLATAGDVTDAHFRVAYRRIRRFALFAAKFALDPAEVTVLFQDQDLVGKFPEPLALPPGVDRFDALLEDADGKVYLFTERGYWAYAARSYALENTDPRPLTDLSPRFAGLSIVDAAFTDAAGTRWLVGRDRDKYSHAFTKALGTTYWTRSEQLWGRIRNNFTDPARIDTAFVDDAGRAYLFCGDQYVRYSTADYTYVDEGYPRTLGEWREDEGPHVRLAAHFRFALDASFQGLDGTVHLFKDDRCLAVGGDEQPLADVWGRVRNSFDQAERIDAGYTVGTTQFLFSGPQVVGYTDGIENSGVRVDDGSPQRIEALLGDVPPEFENAVDAALVDGADVVHLFKDGRTVALTDGPRTVEPTNQRWGVLGPVLPSGTVDAAFVGLDGKTYLFSGDRYIRYSGADYAVVDVGYPRRTAGDWGGLDHVTAAFVLDGRTYLFGTAGEAANYVQYSTRDYATPDAGFPKPLPDNWWNLPVELVPEFATVDAVFTGRDKLTYLFSGNQFVVFDSLHRWWSEVRTLSASWDSLLPFQHVDAAFVGSDGKTYVFDRGQYVRYSTADLTRVDDRYPAPIATFWGNVVNNIARTGKVDAALALDSPEPRTYLFSGDQFVRYTGHAYTTVDNGYPKNLASLREEPRLANLGVVLDHVDAALADQRNVYLFSGRDCHVVSDAAYRRYDLGMPSVGCAFVDDGSVLVSDAGGWQRYSALEGRTIARTPVRPRALRTVPAEFRDGPDAILRGTDGNTYLFKGTACFNTAMGRAYPLAEEWGRARNNVYEDNTVDAAFVGRDGKTYVFSGDQFVVYGGETYLGAEVEGEPRSVPEHWAGLENVALAYVHGGYTFLFERPDDEGGMRYLVYSGTDYGHPDEGSPAVTDASFWPMPDDARPDGFVAPDAVLTEGRTLLLVTGEECLQYDDLTGEWNRPRPIDRIWPGLGEPAILAAFTGRDGAAYFFFDDEFTRYHERSLAPRRQIREQWGRARNEFAGKDGAGRVDAAVVVGEDTTFLFSGTQYVRYTGDRYRYVDAGYPKPIATNLRGEPEFAALPESFEDVLGERLDSGTALIDAVVANERNIYLFVGAGCHVVSRALTATYDIRTFGRLRNNIADDQKVDAALVADGRTFLFSGDQYVRYSGRDYTFVDDGYPRTIESAPPGELSTTELPEPFRYGIDAAFHGSDDVTYLFAGKEYVRADGSAPRPVTELWGKVANAFTDGHDHYTRPNTVDAALVAPTGELYAFRGGQFVRYQPGRLELAEEGYPRTIRDDWGDLPAYLETGITGAFTFEGRGYLMKDNQYVRYSGGGYAEIDRTFPQTFRERWANTADYRLSDVLTMVRFLDLARTKAPGLAQFLRTGAADPYTLLSGLFGWDADELRWLKRHGGFLPSGGAPEYRFELEFLLAATGMFELAGKLGSTPSRLHADVWARVYGDRGGTLAFDDALTVLSGLLAKAHGAEWPTVEREIHDELNLLRRDALVSAVVAETGSLVTTRDLFEYLLVDVDMGSAARTSKVREAIAATQLYLHRYLLNLEDVTVREGDDEQDTRRRLKRWWQWMRAYRVWEANRKVFLYPENYLRPELRGAKTPAFQQLQDDLLQGEVTSDAVVRSYKRYLDEYTEVSRLAIAGGYVYPKEGADSQTRNLVLFGTTRTDPRRYYYRYAEIRGVTKLSTTWEPWLKVGVQIDSDDVSPIHAFGRVFVFWATSESSTPTSSSATIEVKKVDDTQQVSNTAATNRVKLCYSFLDLNGEWLPVQSRTVDTGLPGSVSGLKVAVRLSETGTPEDRHTSIVITASCSIGILVPILPAFRWTAEFSLPPELNLSQLSTSVVPGMIVDPKQDTGLREEIFDPAPTNRIGDARVVEFNSTSGDSSWFSIDHRGGSFLFRPGAALMDERVQPTGLAHNGDDLPTWRRISAAVELPNGTRLFFINFRTRPSRYIEWPRGGSATDEEPIRNRWKLPSVDAAYAVGERLYLVSGGALYRYSLATDRRRIVPDVLDDGYPKPLAHAVDAVFKRDGWLFVFGGSEYTRISADVELDAATVSWRPIKGNWGGLPVAFASTIDSMLDSVDGLFVFKGGEYVRYDKDAGTDTADDTDPVRPYDRTALMYEIVRLTTGTAHKLNERLLTGGVAALLHPRTQEYDEVPTFSTTFSNDTTIQVNGDRVDESQVPTSTHLDFDSANGIYYWEIFFHAPLLIAQALNGAQRFEEARQWYEYVFDPTQHASYWRYLPFLAVDPTALAASCRADLFALAGQEADAEALTKAGLDVATLRGLLEPLLVVVDRVAPLFRIRQQLDDAQTADFATLSAATVHETVAKRLTSLTASVGDESRAALVNLREKAAIVAGLPRQHGLLGDPVKLINAYQDDPFDPHAIAALRPVAYRRAVVMAYVDNLLDWGDMLFRQYTPESVDEARMLYIFAYDLLGTRPETLGTRLLPPAQSLEGLEAEAKPGELDLRSALTNDGALLRDAGEVHASVANRYFSIPGNGVFADYWVRVEDRLRKIRLSQNILGISQPLPLFAPPIDPMALVEGAATGADLGRLGQDAAVPVPHYRFSFLHRKAQDLVEKVRGLGSDLLSVLEREDGEALSLLRNRQEGTILAMTRAIKDAQVVAAEADVAELVASQDGATKRLAYYEKLVDDGLLPLESAQIGTMAFAGAAHLYSGANRIGAAFAYGMPQALLGPFIMGTEIGGKQAGKIFDKTSEIWESLGEGFSVIGELLGVRAGQERSMAEWRSQRDTAEADLNQIEQQLTSARQQLAIAERERDILAAEIGHNEAEATFLTGKFTNAELYQWLSGRLAETYFQAYNLAYEMARSAERAFQFERGSTDGDTRYIRPSYWDSRRNGLLAAEGLGLDLERLGKAYLDEDNRDLEITKPVSLLELDPVALLRMQKEGHCEFSLSEALFDYDFPGHFRRQVRTVAVAFVDEDGQPLAVNATLSQLGHKTVVAAEAKAVKYLLDPKGPVPATVRVDWRAGQRIALSPVDEGALNNGLFELRYDDDRYLPFEGTGAVSTWRLELAGRRPAELHDVVVTVRYTAEAGDQVFTNAVKGMLKAYPAARFLDVATEFPQEWEEFLATDTRQLTLPIGPELFPNMSSRQITGIYPKYDLANGGTARFVLNGDMNVPLTDGKLVPTPGLRLAGDEESGWVLALDGDKEALTNLGLVLTYKAGV
ncbi:MAG: hemopexin repeat-containing protein [Actinophytocola sp.]|uniref:Tc toxin subunit A-related protein n=1 Tax=Actinophytocola sp. TaxID=1872138 RepID=UPI003D6BF678